MRLIVITVVSWLAGLAAYDASLWLFWRQHVSPGDRPAVLFWSGIATVLGVAVAYGPVLFGVRQRNGTAGWGTYTLVSVALGVVPVLSILLAFGGVTFSELFGSETMLFACMFSTFGVVFGTGFWLAYGRRSA